MENGHVTVYALWFSLIVSFDGLLLLHFYKWRMGSEPYMPYGLDVYKRQDGQFPVQGGRNLQ